jgi:hypothetical protein
MTTNQPSGVGITGADVSVMFEVEKYQDNTGVAPIWRGTYNVDPVATKSPFFIGGKLTNMERNNNLEVVYSFGSREPSWIVAKSYSGSMSIEGLLSSPWPFIAVFGGYDVNASLGNYEHAFTPVTGISSLTVHNFIDFSSEPSSPIDESRIVEYVFTGCVCSSFNISASVGEIGTCKMDFVYANEKQNANASSMITETPFGNNDSYNFFPFTFAHGHVYWNNNKLAEVQSVEISINPNNELVYGFGSRMASSAVGKQIEYDITVTLLFEDPFVLFDYLYGGTEVARDNNNVSPSPCISSGLNMEIYFDNSGCGKTESDADYRSIAFSFGGCIINTDSIPQSPNEMVIETTNIKAKTLTITARNNISVLPGLPGNIS